MQQQQLVVLALKKSEGWQTSWLKDGLYQGELPEDPMALVTGLDTMPEGTRIVAEIRVTPPQPVAVT